MKTPVIFKSLNEVCKQNTFGNVKRDNGCRENTTVKTHLFIEKFFYRFFVATSQVLSDVNKSSKAPTTEKTKLHFSLTIICEKLNTKGGCLYLIVVKPVVLSWDFWHLMHESWPWLYSPSWSSGSAAWFYSNPGKICHLVTDKSAVIKRANARWTTR